METKRLRSFKELIVWQKAYRLVLEIYKATRDFPKFEIYSLTQQMRKAAISIPSNIAEGYGRKHKTEYHHFLSIAYGSLSELETQYLLSIDLGYIKKKRNYRITTERSWKYALSHYASKELKSVSWT